VLSLTSVSSVLVVHSHVQHCTLPWMRNASALCSACMLATTSISWAIVEHVHEGRHYNPQPQSGAPAVQNVSLVHQLCKTSVWCTSCAKRQSGAPAVQNVSLVHQLSKTSASTWPEGYACIPVAASHNLSLFWQPQESCHHHTHPESGASAVC